MKDVVALLSGTELFGGLGLDDLTACAAAFRTVSFARGELVSARGDAGTRLYLVADGRVRLAIATSEGRELSFRHAVKGDLFGELAALDGGARSADAQLLGASRPKVNAALGALEAAGAIKRTPDRPFCDPVKLSEFARHDEV